MCAVACLSPKRAFVWSFVHGFFWFCGITWRKCQGTRTVSCKKDPCRRLHMTTLSLQPVRYSYPAPELWRHPRYVMTLRSYIVDMHVQFFRAPRAFYFVGTRFCFSLFVCFRLFIKFPTLFWFVLSFVSSMMPDNLCGVVCKPTSSGHVWTSSVWIPTRVEWFIPGWSIFPIFLH